VVLYLWSYGTYSLCLSICRHYNHLTLSFTLIKQLRTSRCASESVYSPLCSVQHGRKRVGLPSDAAFSPTVGLCDRVNKDKVRVVNEGNPGEQDGKKTPSQPTLALKSPSLASGSCKNRDLVCSASWNRTVNPTSLLDRFLLILFIAAEVFAGALI